MTKLSVIIPAHNEAARICQTIDQVMDFLAHQPYLSELIIVENGSRDATAEFVSDLQVIYPPFSPLRLIQLDEGDKGQAVKAGMLEARGELRYMADADLSTEIQQVTNFIGLRYQTDADIVIGVRDPIYGQTKLRQIMSDGFSVARSSILDLGIQDTQAGFKLFTAAAAEMIFPKLQIMGWAFDVEVLYLAQQLGLSVAELPIPWTAQPGSKIKPLDPVRMLLDLARIKTISYETA